MKIVIAIFTLLLVQFLTFAQSYDIKLKISDVGNNTPIANANISVSERFFGTTNNFGEVLFKDISMGNYFIKISHISYKTFEFNIELLSDTVIYINLSSESVKLQDVIVTANKYEQNIQDASIFCVFS